MYKFIYKILCWLDTFGVFIKIPFIERKVQAIFNKVIDHDFYAAQPIKTHSRHYMCYALNDAEECNLITYKERAFAKKEVHRYLKDEGFLCNKLATLDYPRTPIDCLNTYRNWSSRPFTKKI